MCGKVCRKCDAPAVPRCWGYCSDVCRSSGWGVGPNGAARDRAPRSSALSSRHKGVSWHKQAKKWSAQIEHGGRQEKLGLFATEEEAKAAHGARCVELGVEVDHDAAPPTDADRAVAREVADAAARATVKFTGSTQSSHVDLAA
jgi:hypothetical protein